MKENVKGGGAGCLAATLIAVPVGILLAVLIIYCISSYNGLVKRDEGVGAQWARVESQYQRRADLVENLVAVVRGYADHEQETLVGVIEARAKATGITVTPETLSEGNIEQFQAAQEGLSSALSRLMVSVEQYPQLKADALFQDLSGQLREIEGAILGERNGYNEAARDYNTHIRRFPKNLIAKMFGFDAKGYFKSMEGAATAPKVNF